MTASKIANSSAAGTVGDKDASRKPTDDDAGAAKSESQRASGARYAAPSGCADPSHYSYTKPYIPQETDWPVPSGPPGKPVNIAKGIVKRILINGDGVAVTGWAKNSKATFHVRILMEKHCLLSTMDKYFDPFDLRLGRSFAIPSWETCVKTMCIGERAVFACEPSMTVGVAQVVQVMREIGDDEEYKMQCEAAGVKYVKRQLGGCACSGKIQELIQRHPDIQILTQMNPPLNFEIELMSVEHEGEYKKDHWEKTAVEKAQEVPILRETGNQKFREGKLKEAVELYKVALTYIDHLIKRPAGEDETKPNDVSEHQIPCLLNFSACQLKLKEYEQAIEACTTALTVDCSNVKAYYRRGLAKKMKGRDPEAAKQDFEKALELDPTNKSIITSICETDALIANAKTMKKGIYSKMFG